MRGAKIRRSIPITTLPKHIPNHVISRNIPNAMKANPSIFFNERPYFYILSKVL